MSGDDDMMEAVLSGLNPRDAAFVMAVVGGSTASEAYRLAGWTVSDEHLASAASRKLRQPKIQDAIVQLRGVIASDYLLTIEEKRFLLASIVRGQVRNGLIWEGCDIKTRLKAIEIDNRMVGHEAVTEVNVQGGFLGALLDGSRLPDYGLRGDLKLGVDEAL